jgi:hypothetical protein
LNKPTEYVKAHVPAPDNPLQSEPVPAVVKVGESAPLKVSALNLHGQLKGQEIGAYLLKRKGEYQVVLGLTLFQFLPILQQNAIQSLHIAQVKGSKRYHQKRKQHLLLVTTQVAQLGLPS